MDGRNQPARQTLNLLLTLTLIEEVHILQGIITLGFYDVIEYMLSHFLHKFILIFNHGFLYLDEMENLFNVNP